MAAAAPDMKPADAIVDRVAVHEAGHAVMILHLGHTFDMVSIRGEQRWDGDRLSLTRAFVRGAKGAAGAALALIAVAGCAAEVLDFDADYELYFAGRPGRLTRAERLCNWMKRHVADMRTYDQARAAAEVSPNDAEDALQVMQSQIGKVQKLAVALAASERGELSYDEVRNVLN